MERLFDLHTLGNKKHRNVTTCPLDVKMFANMLAVTTCNAIICQGYVSVSIVVEFLCTSVAKKIKIKN